MSRRNIRSGPVVKEERREKAAKLAEARAARTPEEQLALLDKKLGKMIGAVRERARLAGEIEKRREKKSRGKTSRDGEGERRASKSSAKTRRERDRGRSRQGASRGRASNVEGEEGST